MYGLFEFDQRLFGYQRMTLKMTENGLLYLLFLTLGTYAVPALRIGLGEVDIP